MKLETLPSEITHSILSYLDLHDRKIVRQCSKTLEEAVQQSDLTVYRIDLIFDEMYENSLEVSILLSKGDDEEAISININNHESIKSWLAELSQRWFFRRLSTRLLAIICNDEPVYESIVQNVANQFDFRGFYLEFCSRNQQSVLNFALRTKKEIDTINF
ncbi:hypothetical protein PFISCL1PPCAC_17961, partial [Pristionchus fissidentatus]